MKKIRVLIVDDSIFFREFMSRCLSKEPNIDVIGMASDVQEAIQQLEQKKPDIIILDMEMPDSRGTDFLHYIRPKYPHIQVIAISSFAGNVFEALKAGAVDFVPKPNVQAKVGHVAFINESIEKIKMAAATRMQESSSPPAPTPPVSMPEPAAAPPSPTFGASTKPASSQRTVLPKNSPKPPSPSYHAPVSAPAPVRFTGVGDSRQIIAIGASTGGTEAILSVLKDLPETTPGIVVVQHMPPVFTRMYAERLDGICKMRVREAQSGDRVERGLVLIAPGNQHMRLRKDQGGYYVNCSPGEKVSGHCPSVDALFESVARFAGAHAIGVILTGMGADGANQLLEMRKAGAYTICQDQSTCVVYGMPMAAYKLGAAVEQLPLQAIPDAILRHLGK